jgi:hypothetical protein
MAAQAVTVFGFYFGWYQGAVWSNLLASAICTALIWWRLHRQAARHHVEQLAQAAAHHLERITQAQEHHEALKAHVTATAAAPRPASRRAKTLVTEPAKEERP